MNLMLKLTNTIANVRLFVLSSRYNLFAM